MNYSIIRILSLSFAVTFFYVSGSLFAANLDDLPRDHAQCTIDDLPRDPVQNKIAEYALTSKPYPQLTKFLIAQQALHCFWSTPLATLKNISLVAISPNNESFVAASGNVALIYKMSDFSVLVTLSGHTKEISSIAISPDGSKVITTSYDQAAKIWNMADGSLINTIDNLGEQEIGHPFAVISPDGSKFVTLFEKIKIWNMADFSLIATITEPQLWDPETPIIITPDGSKLITVVGGAKIRHMENGSFIGALYDGNNGPICSAEITPDGLQVVIGYCDGNIKIFNSVDGSPIRTLPDKHNGRVISIKISRDCRFIVTGDRERVKIRNMVDGSVIARLQKRCAPLLAISPDDFQVLTGGSVDGVKIWSADDGSFINELSDHIPLLQHPREIYLARVHSVAINSDCSRLITVSKGGIARIWNMPLFALFESLKGLTVRQLFLLDWLHEVQRKGYKANLNPNNIDLKMNPDPKKPDQEKQRCLINNYRAQYDALPALIKELVHDFVIL